MLVQCRLRLFECDLYNLQGMILNYCLPILYTTLGNTSGAMRYTICLQIAPDSACTKVLSVAIIIHVIL